jgi:hypothetical protein
MWATVSRSDPVLSMPNIGGARACTYKRTDDDLHEGLRHRCFIAFQSV